MGDGFSKAIEVGMNRPDRVLFIDEVGMRGIY